MFVFAKSASSSSRGATQVSETCNRRRHLPTWTNVKKLADSIGMGDKDKAVYLKGCLGMVEGRLVTLREVRFMWRNGVMVRSRALS